MAGRTRTVISKDILYPGELDIIDGTLVFRDLKWVGSRGDRRHWQIFVEAVAQSPAGEYHKIPIEADWLDATSNETQYFSKNSGRTYNILGRYFTQTGQISGALSKSEYTYVLDGKNLGKKNATSAFRQAVADAMSEYNKKIKQTSDKAVITETGEVQRALANSELPSLSSLPSLPSLPADDDKMIKPERAQKENATKRAIISDMDYADGMLVQYKLDGVNGIYMQKKNGDILGYSRALEPIMGCKQVYREMVELYKYTEDAHPYFIGEFYLHGKKLQWISGQFRKEEDEGNLMFYIYDCFFVNEEIDYDDPDKMRWCDKNTRARQAYITAVFDRARAAGCTFNYLVRLDTLMVHSDSELRAYYERARADGYEGIIARRTTGIFTPAMSDKRTPDIIKIKKRDDNEYEIVDFKQGVGKDEGALIWICKLDAKQIIDPHQTAFTVVSNEELELRKKLYKYLLLHPEAFEQYFKHQPITIEYSEISATTNIPQQPRARTLYPRTFYENVGVVKGDIEELTEKINAVTL